MKNTNKAFTLVELIVVITILAILGTIAFISLQGYSQEAKNSKVSTDLTNLNTAISTSITRGTATLAWIVKNDSASNKVANTNTITYKQADGTNATWALDWTTISYLVGNVDFPALGQNPDDFKDPEGKDYIIAVAYTGSTAYYQLAGQTKNAAWNYAAVIKGSYVKINASDANGLVSKSGASDNGVTKDQDLGITGLY